jgi:pilus assembly protein Flp/PilA
MLTHLFTQAKLLLGFVGVSEEEGQGLIEYALIVLLIAIAVLLVLGTLGGQVEAIFQSISDSITGEGIVVPE